MMSTGLIGTACAVAVCAGLLAGNASAQTIDEKTYFTFKGPVDVPSVVLARWKIPLPSGRSGNAALAVRLLRTRSL